MTHQTLLRLAALLSMLAPVPAPAQTAARPPAAQAAGYHWRALVLQHAKPDGILRLMHWNGPDAPPRPAALPPGVLRIFALQSNNSLLLEATDEGYAMAAKLIGKLDIAPRSVEFHMEIVAVSKSRARLYTPGIPASRLLSLLLAGESRVVLVPTETVTDNQAAFFSADVPFITLPTGRFRLAQVEPKPGRRGPSARYAFRLTPRINADDTITLGLEFGTAAPLLSTRTVAPRTLRAGEIVVYDVTSPTQPDGERLFLFLQPLIIGGTGVTRDGGGAVTVTP